MAYIGRQPITGQFEKQQLTADGSTTSFALNWTVGSTSALIVSVGGVLQEPETAYTLSGGGTNIVFTAAPASGDRVYIHFLGQAIVQNLTDVNGVELILDANGNTSITADTDDTIDIKVGGYDDFQITANTFTSLSGSTIKTNTIAETTSTSGVTIDGLLIKDSKLDTANSVDSDAYVDGSIDLAHMSVNSIDSDQYVDGSIDTAHIANLQITTALIAADAITAAKIADDVINSEHYAAASIDNEHLADDAVDSDELAAGSVDLAHMSVNSIDSDQYVDGSIDLAHMSVNSIDSDQYVDGSIDTAHIADNQVTLAKMAGLVRGKIIYGDASGDPAALTVGTNGQVLKSDGTDISWGTDSGGAALTGSTNNQVVTVTGADAIAGEANLLFDGEVLDILGNPTVSEGATYNLTLANDTDNSTSGAAHTGILFKVAGNDSTPFNATSIECHKTNNSNANYSADLVFGTRNDGVNTVVERLRITNDGDVEVAVGNIVMSTSGKGVDFSATADSSGTSESELLHDYEEGTFTPTMAPAGGGTTTHTTQAGYYVKIGKFVSITGGLGWSAQSGSGQPRISSLPFAISSQDSNYGGHSGGMCDMTLASADYQAVFVPQPGGVYANIHQNTSGTRSAAPHDASAFISIGMTYEATT